MSKQIYSETEPLPDSTEISPDNSHTAPLPVLKKRKKKKKGLIIFLIVLILVIAAGAGFYFWQRQKPVNTVKKPWILTGCLLFYRTAT